MQNDYSAGLANFRRHLRLARLALVSDELYEEAVEAERDNEHERIRAEVGFQKHTGNLVLSLSLTAFDPHETFRLGAGLRLYVL
jgi:hypothetical protein